MRILIDADGCPVRDEVYRVARRYDLDVLVVANSGFVPPPNTRIQCVQVDQGLDAADDWIVANGKPDDIVVTSDVPLASRCVRAVAAVLRPDGRKFSEEDIGGALAMRDLMTELREAGVRTRGPAPFTERDRASFLQALDAVIQKVRRTQPRT